ncbi:hypothetical protein CLAFUW4_11516 [Fulvia fulva]|uniref:Uncharacterized protein n=1 Tax=Passalora fulva TaxID=5499 RepID=A0A9Q8PC61_PASFU|nr:uncharacterized protein CLAFUR5_10559 [Fulvia fulva]KAK4619583.1 hypothetical protein CLAFUR4_11522 [Fulvia fulva]KAK4621065.1 hypothetical protein CLAFUR0_11530 [Fulvia fulva]UJO19753.1 hypothetical protein CLAFUR5_10559 [Fulvia fulva]WPV17555.1 hypothetical protein CLAFUW4_11516 [Fulvia fulva]WPV32641.1 hypothetical protein CLAFUW7_11521 [Fulvia fulva]
MTSSVRPQARRAASGAWNRFKQMPQDPLDHYGLPSKGETRLHDPKVQEAYYTKIVERYMKFCATEDLDIAFNTLSLDSSSFNNNNNTPPLSATGPTGTKYGPNSRPPLTHSSTTTGAPSPSTDLPNILLAMRKLREGIFATRRRDTFAQIAYKFIIHASILSRSWEHYKPSLDYLLYSIHPHTPLSSTELAEFVTYRILDLSCRQNDLLEAVTIRQHFSSVAPGLSAGSLRRVNVILQALVHNDWVRFWRVRRVVDGYQRAIMEFAVPEMRLHALKCVGKGYLQADRAFVERSGDRTWEELVGRDGVGWELGEDGRVVIRRAKGM